MLEVIKTNIANAQAAMQARKASVLSDEEQLAEEIAILKSHATCLERIQTGESEVVVMQERLAARDVKDYIRNFAQQANNDMNRLDMLAGQFAGLDAISRHKDEIMREFRAIALGGPKAELERFEREHAKVLKKHGAIN